MPSVEMDEHNRPVHLIPLGRNARVGQSDGGEGSAESPSTDKPGTLVATYMLAMKPESASGPDGLPVPFIRNVRVKAGSTHEYVLLPVLRALITCCIKLGRIPDAWKSARITPLHKKGDPLVPDNYRMLAVSSCLYRLHANIVRDLLTAWCVDNHRIPDAQFGFYPGRNTLQPIFILRHLIHAGHRRAGKHRQVYAAFIDSTQAYDTVDRTRLWEHLKQENVPDFLLRIFRDMYDGDTYELVDGDKRTGHISPARGVKQGCPLSPLLFALYVNDVSKVFTADMGALAGCTEDAIRVSHLMYADDLTLISNCSLKLQVMLDKLSSYAAKKGLTVNVRKSQVVVFNPSERDRSTSTQFLLAGQPLEIVEEFKFLGVMVNEKGCMTRAAEYAARPFTAAIKRVGEIGSKFCVRDCPHAMLWLFQSYALSAGLYGSQVWCTPLLLRLLRNEKASTDIHLRHLGFVKRCLHVKRSVSNQVALREAGQMPMHFYWLRSVVKFWNACVGVCTRKSEESEIPCPILHGVLLADLQLARDKRERCWSRDVTDVLNSLGLQLTLASNMAGGTGERQLRTVNVDDVVSALCVKLKGVWVKSGACDPRDDVLPPGCSRKLVTYDRWMAVPWEEEKKPPLPAYLRTDLPGDVTRDMARFRTSSHHLRIETGRWVHLSLHQRICDMCRVDGSRGVIQDEKHVLLECPALGDIRRKYGELLHACDGDMLKLMSVNPKRLAWFIHDCTRKIERNTDYVCGENIDVTGETASSLVG